MARVNDNMKTIEEKAFDFAGIILPHVVDKYQSASIAELRHDLAHIYLAGAREALSGQWRNPMGIERCPEPKVITCYRATCNGERVTVTTVEDPKNWQDNIHKGHDLINWMSIPELPKFYVP